MNTNDHIKNAPEWLDEIDRAKYGEIVAKLDGREVDPDTVGLLAQAWGRYQKAAALLEAEGLVLEAGERRWHHPAATVLDSAIKQITKLSALLGIAGEVPKNKRRRFEGSVYDALHGKN